MKDKKATEPSWFGVKASWRSVVHRIAVVAVAVVAYYLSPLGDVTERFVSRRSEFALRHVLSPKRRVRAAVTMVSLAAASCLTPFGADQFFC